MAQQPFNRTEKPPECEHPVQNLHAPVPENGPGVVPRTVMSCRTCKQTWTGGHALAIYMVSAQREMNELRRLATEANNRAKAIRP